MISIEEARALIEGDEEYTDAEIEQIRDECRILAELAFEKWIMEKQLKK